MCSARVSSEGVQRCRRGVGEGTLPVTPAALILAELSFPDSFYWGVNALQGTKHSELKEPYFQGASYLRVRSCRSQYSHSECSSTGGTVQALTRP